MEHKNIRIVKREDDFAEWYSSIVKESNLIIYTDIKGFMIFKPRGWAIWENIKSILDNRFKNEMDVNNLYMPLLIPISEFEKEKEHVEGFAPELFTVTEIGSKKLENKLAIRPTSEIWFCKYFKDEIKSYKDLPIKVNQWTSVLRAEKNTKPFLRNSEFHWHETHAAFASFEEAKKYSVEYLNLYADFCENDLAIPVIKGMKTPNETFAGADTSYTIESMMQDGQALQSGTSHILGQNFAKSYDIKYQDKNNELQYAWTTSHGLTTRIIGAIIMVHADDNGLVLPFNVADKQIRIFPLFSKKNPETLEYANEIYNQLKTKYRTEIIDNDKSIGYLLSESEINGTPINIIVGPNDVKNKTFTYSRRDDSIKHTINIENLENEIEKAKKTYHDALFTKAKNKLNNNIVDVHNFDEFKDVIQNKKWARCFFDINAKIEQEIKELTGATARCIIENKENKTSNCFYSNNPTKTIVIFAKAY